MCICSVGVWRYLGTDMLIVPTPFLYVVVNYREQVGKIKFISIMKTLRLIGTTLLMVVLCLNFTACGDDDDDEITSDNLVGRWVMIHQQGYEKYEEMPNLNEEWNGAPEGDDFVNFTFNADGTFDEGEGGKWTLHGNTLTLKYYYNGEVDEVYELKVLELSSSKAVLEIQYKETEHGSTYEYYNKMTYQKQ